MSSSTRLRLNSPRAALLSVGVIVASTLVMLIAVVWANVRPRPIEPVEMPYAVGSVFASIAGVSAETADRTLLIFSSSTCAPCVDALVRVGQMRAESKDANVHIVAVSTEPRERFSEYLERLKVIPDSVVSIRYPPDGIVRVPTIAIVDRHNRLLQLWDRSAADSQLLLVRTCILEGKCGDN